MKIAVKFDYLDSTTETCTYERETLSGKSVENYELSFTFDFRNRDELKEFSLMRKAENIHAILWQAELTNGKDGHWALSKVLHNKKSETWKTCKRSESASTSFEITLHFFLNWVCMNPLNKSFSDLLNKQTNCDVHFTLQNGEIIGAHSFMLTARSPVFAAMLHHEESRTKLIDAKDTDPGIFKQFLKFLYSSQFANFMSFEHYARLYALAHKYQMKDVTLLENRLLTDTAPEDAVRVLLIADRYSREDLKKCALELIKNNTVSFAKSPALLEFIKESPELCALALRQIIGGE